LFLKSDVRPYPEEIPGDGPHFEGAVLKVTVNRYERDAKARAKSILQHGTSCLVCGFDFEASFGAIGAGFIHVHHVIEISTIKERYRVNPVTDLKAVCPNCHAMLHRRTPAYSLDELRRILKV
jgi:5-methylcytosine-specific restriction enzyme A